MTPNRLSERERFHQLLDLFPATTAFTQHYVAQAKVRGWLTFQHLPRGTGREILLDVGGMDGLFAPAYMDIWNYAQVQLIGMDAPESGRVVRASPQGQPYVFPAARCNIELESWPYPDAFFDAAVCTEVLEHLIFDPVHTMNELNRVLKPGGQALITVPNAASDSCLTFLVNGMQPGFLRNYLSDALASGRRDLNTVAHLGHFHEYTGMELKSLIHATGFEVLRLAGLTFFPPHLVSWRFTLLKKLVHMLFPRSRRIREDHVLAIIKKQTFVPLSELRTRYPAPLYRSLS